MLRRIDGVQVVGEAESGTEALTVIEAKRPNLALVDIQLPELDGLTVVRLLKKDRVPHVTFLVTSDQYAVEFFESNALDYIVKPVQNSRVSQTIERLRKTLEDNPYRADEAERLRVAAADYETSKPLLRIPARHDGEIVLIPVDKLVSVVAKGGNLYLHSSDGKEHTIYYRLHDLAARLDPDRFVRVGRGAIINIDMIHRIVPATGGVFTIVLSNNHEFKVSRIQSRILRETILKL